MARGPVEKLVASLPWLDKVADAVQPAVEKTFSAGGPAGKVVKDFLNGVWLGHPLHAAASDVPIGAWTMAQLLDVIAMTGENREDLDKAADILLGTGVVSAVGVAMAGLADWSDIHGEHRRVGLLHAMMNSAGLTLNAASLAIRMQGGNRGVARALSAAGFGVALGAAWVAGELVYKMGVGVNRNAWVDKPKKFRDAIAEDDLPEGKPVKVEVAGTTIALLKHEDGIHAFGGICPHYGGPLWEGEIEGHTVTCPWHGSQFDIATGDTLHGPATAPLPCFEVRRYGGQIQVRLERDSGERGGGAGN